MNQICDGYNPRVRMGNWLEQSYSVPQVARNNPQKQLRQADIDISYIDAHLKLRPLNRIARLPPWNTSGLVQAPQYQGLTNKTLTKQNFDIGVNQHYFQKWKPTVYDKNCASGIVGESSIKLNQYKKEHRMFDERNVNQLINDRSVEISSFKSSLIPQRHINQKDLLKSVYQIDISRIGSKMQENVKNSEFQKTMKYTCPQFEKPAFRKIRSEITLKNIPLIKTYK